MDLFRRYIVIIMIIKVEYEKRIEIVPNLFYCMGLISARGSTRISRVMIFIDGAYLQNHIPHVEHGEINYSALAGHLISNSNFGSPTLVRCYFYDGLQDPDQDLSYLEEQGEVTKRKNENKEQHLKKKEALEKIAMLDYFEVRKGKAVYYKSNDKKRLGKWFYRQKGVDSLIAIDILTKAYQDHYDVGVLVAGDSDFIEIVKAVKNSEVNIMGAYFEENMSRELEHEFDRKLLLNVQVLRNKNIIMK